MDNKEERMTRNSEEEESVVCLYKFADNHTYNLGQKKEVNLIVHVYTFGSMLQEPDSHCTL